MGLPGGVQGWRGGAEAPSAGSPGGVCDGNSWGPSGGEKGWARPTCPTRTGSDGLGAPQGLSHCTSVCERCGHRWGPLRPGHPGEDNTDSVCAGQVWPGRARGIPRPVLLRPSGGLGPGAEGPHTAEDSSPLHPTSPPVPSDARRWVASRRGVRAPLRTRLPALWLLSCMSSLWAVWRDVWLAQTAPVAWPLQHSASPQRAEASGRGSPPACVCFGGVFRGPTQTRLSRPLSGSGARPPLPQPRSSQPRMSLCDFFLPGLDSRFPALHTEETASPKRAGSFPRAPSLLRSSSRVWVLPAPRSGLLAVPCTVSTQWDAPGFIPSRWRHLLWVFCGSV